MKKYFDRIDQNWYEENELRKFCFDYETQDLRNNLDNFVEGIYNIEGQCDILKLTLKGDIKEVVERLNLYWNYSLVSEEDYYMEQYTFLSSKCGDLEKQLEDTKLEIKKVQSIILSLEDKESK